MACRLAALSLSSGLIDKASTSFVLEPSDCASALSFGLKVDVDDFMVSLPVVLDESDAPPLFTMS